MAKRQSGLCMLCGGDPCECSGGPKKKSSTSTRKASSPKTESKAGVSSQPSDSDTEDVYGDVPTAQSKFKSESALESEPDLVALSALRNLRHLVDPSSQKKIDAELNRPYPQAIDRRIIDWKTRVREEE